MGGQATPSRNYPAGSRLALEVSGAPKLINVPCNGGIWHWSGQEPAPYEHSPVQGGGTGPIPKTDFVIIDNGRATAVPVR